MGTHTGTRQRCWEHDYCSPSFYMVTLVTEPRRNCLSFLDPGSGAGYAGSGAEPGTEPVSGPAGSVSGAAPAGSVAGPAPGPEFPTLWEDGFQDTIRLHRGQLKAMVNYIADNPRRLLLKRANPDLFTVVRDLEVAPGRTCPAIGNLFLLDQPVKRQVQISRSISSDALAEKKAELLSAARHGAVLFSPCISPGEKDIAHAALDAMFPLVVVLTNGFPKAYKPPGRYFDACANGNLLMLAPFPYHRGKRAITREQCLKLNEWAAAVANPGARVAPGTEPVSGAAPAPE